MKDSLQLSNKISRPPVVAVMGHIDHGKSTLLDYIRNSDVVEKEVGGITQHVSAYEVTHLKEPNKPGDPQIPTKITFLDTPGHEAFQSIRSRGASVADIAILVVSAEDGVKPQTLEAYKHIADSKTPFIVAITKIDKPSANIERTKQSLAENSVYVEGYGGSIPVVSVSAKTGEGVHELLEMVLLLADVENFMGDAGRWGSGVIIETRLDAKIGITAVGIIKDGTVKKGMYAASAGTISPLRFILNASGEEAESLSFSSPIQISGWSETPSVGSVFETFDDKRAAQFYAESESLKIKAREIIRGEESDENISILPIIIKTDVAGSLEAIIYEINKIKRERIVPKIVLSGVGTVGEGDVKSAMTTEGTIVFAFNTRIDPQASALAERTGVGIEIYDIIYKLTERINELLTEREPKIEVEEVTGTGKVLKTFGATKDKQVVGIRAESGNFEVDGILRILRRGEEVGRGRLRELQQNKVKTSKVAEGSEFGAMIESKVEIAPGDNIEEITKVTK